MRIYFERTGGFAGRKLQTTLEVSELPEHEARLLLELLDQSHFDSLPIKLPAKRDGVDCFFYRVTVEQESGIHTVEAAESAVPPNLRPLLNWLTRTLFLK